MLNKKNSITDQQITLYCGYVIVVLVIVFATIQFVVYKDRLLYRN